MAWNWMVAGFEWTFPLQRDLTHPPQESTWVVPPMVVVEVVVAVAVAAAAAAVAVEDPAVPAVVTTTVVMTVVMIEGMTEDMTAMMTGTTIGHTGEGPHLHTMAAERTDLDHGLTHHATIEGDTGQGSCFTEEEYSGNRRVILDVRNRGPNLNLKESCLILKQMVTDLRDIK